MKILIIGASGFLGRKMMKILAERNEVFGTFHSKKMKDLFELDRTKKEDVIKIIEKLNPDVVIDANGMTDMDKCESYPDECRKSNVEGTKNIATACKELGKKFVFISTDAVFYGNSSEIYREDFERASNNIYGKSKIAAEEFIESNLDDFLILRTSSLYGYNEKDDKKSFAKFIISEISSGNEVKVADDRFACPALIDDVAVACEKLLILGKKGIFHVAGGECISRYDFALKTAGIFRLDASKIKQAKTSSLSLKSPRPAHLNLSTEKIKSLGIEMRNVEDGLKEMKKQMEND